MKLAWENRREAAGVESWKVGLYQLAGDAALTVTHDMRLGLWWVHPPYNARGDADRPWSGSGPLVETSSRDQVVSVLEREMTRWLNWTGLEERKKLVDSWEAHYRASGQVAPWLR